AQPPGARARRPPPPLSELEPFRDPRIGSNGWAIGKDRTENGRGMLLSNTHFPASGELQWWESHLTVPGELDVYGVSLIGSALVNMGFNEHLAWTHTVSETPRFVVYQLDLDPADPTRYLYDGEYESMTAEDHEIEVLQDDGTVTTDQRTLYHTRWGPMFNAPVVGWSGLHAYTWRDVNDGNLGLLPTFEGMALATSQAEFEEAHRDHQGIPWVHTMFTDAEGTVMYLDSAATPNLSVAATDAYESFSQTDIVSSLFSGFGVIVVDGKDPLYDWVEDPRSVVAGAVPYDEAPRLVRTDFVNNSNENYWLANPLEPLTGYPWVYGPTGYAIQPRTKMNNRFLLEEDGASGPDHKFSLDELVAAASSARASLAEDLLTEVVARCDALGPEEGAGDVTFVLDSLFHTVDVRPACAVLGRWSGTSTVDDVGAYLWRELVGTDLHDPIDLVDQGELFADAFDPADPIYTPTALAPPRDDGSDPVLEALAAAVYRLGEAGIAIDRPLGEVQYRVRGGERIPVLGGHYIEGLISIGTYDTRHTTMLPIDGEVETVVNPNTGLSTDGYLVSNGNSWVMGVSFGEDGPEARAVMTYSESENPESPHFRDQSDLYVDGSFRPVLFREDEILADPELDVVELSYPGSSR
ncbi:MAG: penicillin acylase family protein, partial [Myxococcota bacterium]